jgi:hypothetical protein
MRVKNERTIKRRGSVKERSWSTALSPLEFGKTKVYELEFAIDHQYVVWFHVSMPTERVSTAIGNEVWICNRRKVWYSAVIFSLKQLTAF